MNKFTEIIDLIKSSNKIAVLVHENPDGDAAGSLIAMTEGLHLLGKDVKGYLENIPSNCGFLFPDERIALLEEYNGEAYDLCIVLDCGDIQRTGLGSKVYDNSQKSICMDHHMTNTGFADLNYIDAKASATGEIVFEFFEELGLSMNERMATAMYSAIISDTGRFKNSNTTQKTFEIAAKLMAFPMDITKIAYYMFLETSLERTLFLGKLLSNLKMYCDGKVGVLIAKEDEIEKYGISHSELDGMVEYARNIKGVEVGVFVKQMNGGYKVSLRSNGKVDVAEVAQRFNGGGHKFAAGCKFADVSADEVVKLLVSELED